MLTSFFKYDLRKTSSKLICELIDRRRKIAESSSPILEEPEAAKILFCQICSTAGLVPLVIAIHEIQFGRAKIMLKLGLMPLVEDFWWFDASG